MSGWKQYAGGQRWRVLPTGQIEVEGQGIISSGGAPLTAKLALLEHGDAICAAARAFRIPVPWLVGMAAIEAIRLKPPRGGLAWFSDKVQAYLKACSQGRGWRALSEGDAALARKYVTLRLDPVSVRYEAGYVSPEDTPGRCSAGLMQTLLTTARAMAQAHPEIAPRDSHGALRLVHFGDMLDPANSLNYGAAYLASQRERYKGRIAELTLDGRAAPAGSFDFVLATGSYNAGSIVENAGSPYRLLTYSDSRTQRGIEYHNDCFKAGARELIPDELMGAI